MTRDSSEGRSFKKNTDCTIQPQGEGGKMTRTSLGEKLKERSTYLDDLKKAKAGGHPFAYGKGKSQANPGASTLISTLNLII